MSAAPRNFLIDPHIASRLDPSNVPKTYPVNPDTGLPQHLTNVCRHKGKGWHSKVFDATDTVRQQDVIVKSCKYWEMANEVQALIMLNGTRGVIPILDGFTVGSELYVEVPRFDGDLCEHPACPYFVLHEILGTLCSMHERQIWHRDIKPDNIMKSLSTNEIRLADFGGAHFPGDRPGQGIRVGTDGYMAPEICLGMAYTEKCDVWSLGATVIALLQGARPNKIPTYWTFEQIERWVIFVIDSLDVADKMKAVLLGMMKSDPEERCTAREALAWMDRHYTIDANGNFCIFEGE